MSGPDTATEVPKPRKKRSIWRWGLWALLIALILAIILALFIWLNRYSLIEEVTEDLLLEQGIEAELSIDSISSTQAILKNVRLTDSLADDKSVIFMADKITADYDWREALKGRVDKIVFSKPQAFLTLDENGKIINGWLAPKLSLIHI